MTAGIKVAYPEPLPDPSLYLRSLHEAGTTAPDHRCHSPTTGQPPAGEGAGVPKTEPSPLSAVSWLRNGVQLLITCGRERVGRQLPRSPGPRQHANKTYHVKVDAFLVGMEPVAGAVVK